MAQILEVLSVVRDQRLQEHRLRRRHVRVDSLQPQAAHVGQVTTARAQTVRSGRLGVFERRKLLVASHFPDEEALRVLEHVEDELLELDPVRLVRFDEFSGVIDEGDLLVSTVVRKTG